MAVEPYCPFCGLVDPRLCRDDVEAENCPHAPDYIPEDELDEIEELI